ncbi:hypothetical protein TWF481_009097 [Arthrobotrys musiformis]|uniref:Uncharacterized protein n=1 Tax=Arthrobotrys musiformis TaxID=47236 RepID=A0AAV9W8H0_9PEZI
MSRGEFTNARRSHLMKVGSLLTCPPPDGTKREPNLALKYPLLAPVHTISVSFKHPKDEGRTFMAPGCAFAFSQDYLFTAARALDYHDGKEVDANGNPVLWDVKEVNLCYPLNYKENLQLYPSPNNLMVGRNWTRLGVLYSSKTSGLAVLGAPYCQFLRMEFKNSRTLDIGPKVFVPALLGARPGCPDMKEGGMAEVGDSFCWDITFQDMTGMIPRLGYETNGMAGAPVVDIRGCCLGVHLGVGPDLERARSVGSGPRSHFYTTEGLRELLSDLSSQDRFKAHIQYLELKMVDSGGYLAYKTPRCKGNEEDSSNQPQAKRRREEPEPGGEVRDTR